MPNHHVSGAVAVFTSKVTVNLSLWCQVLVMIKVYIYTIEGNSSTRYLKSVKSEDRFTITGPKQDVYHHTHQIRTERLTELQTFSLHWVRMVCPSTGLICGILHSVISS